MIVARAVVAALAACAAALRMRSFSTKGSQAQLGQQNSLVSLDSYAFPTHEKSVTLSAATTRSKVAAMKLQASEGDGDEDALSPV